MTNHPLMVVLGHLSKFGGGIAAGRMEWAVESEVEAALCCWLGGGGCFLCCWFGRGGCSLNVHISQVFSMHE